MRRIARSREKQPLHVLRPSPSGTATLGIIGPGDVLTRLIVEIRKEPLPTDAPARDVAPAPLPQPSLPRDGVVFLYAGKGSQYFAMGAGLYEQDAAFRAVRDQCSALAAPRIGGSLVEILYRAAKPSSPFDQVLHSNPALFAVGCALTRALKVRGVRPDAVLGYGVGEYAAAVAAGALSLEGGLALAIEQARLLDERAR